MKKQQMSKQEKTPIIPPTSPHWRRLNQNSGVIGRISGRPAAAISRADTSQISPKPSLPAGQSGKAPSTSTPLPAAPVALKQNPIALNQPFWHHIPILSFLISFWLRMAQGTIKTFLNEEKKPAPENKSENKANGASSKPQMDDYNQILTRIWTWLKRILFWGTGAFLFILPFQWISDHYNRLQKGIVGGLSDTFDTKRSSIIPAWIKEILLIALGTLLLPIYLREKIIVGMFWGVWFGTKKTFLFSTRFCLGFPLAVFLTILLIGPNWLTPAGYPNPMNYSNVHQWLQAVERADRLRATSF